MTENVVVLGGGIAGLSAAHELGDRGFDVDVYELRDQFGGKARSIDVPETATEGRKPLPGEHGFRFFPSFYRHVFDTMRRIPDGTDDGTVHDNLVEAPDWLIARRGKNEVTIPLELPDSIEDWQTTLDVFFGDEFDIPDDERRFFIDRLLTFLTSCEDRRREEYETLSWWEFIEAEDKSEGYQQYFGIGVTRSLVAMQAEISSTRTIGRIYVQLLLGYAMPWLDLDRMLDGPTTDTWISPWVDHLEDLGVTFHPETAVEEITCEGGEITGVDVRADGQASTVTGDYYVSAVPVEVMGDLVTESLAAAAPSLSTLDQVETAWMNGIQFYLDEDNPISHGHLVLQGAPWALTAISQQQFWDSDLSEYGSGDVEGILSVCISDWTTPGTTVEKPANECTPEEIKREVWAQFEHWLNEDDTAELNADNVVDWFLDPAIEIPAGDETTNAEPLLINTVGSLQHRPNADTAVPNLFLASDYVRTNTDLATMEAANEAARRAVNGILDASDSDADRCDVWELEEPTVFEPMKAYDSLRYDMGLPHSDA